jgi:hypothetical protein
MKNLLAWVAPQGFQKKMTEWVALFDGIKTLNPQMHLTPSSSSFTTYK